MRRPPSSALKDRLQQLGPNEVIINHWASCFELVCRFSSGLCVHCLVDILCCPPCYFHSMLWGVCVFNVTDMLPSMFHLHFQCFYWVLRNNRKQNPIYAASVIANTFSPSSISHSHTPRLCQSLWASLQVLGFSVKQPNEHGNQSAVCALDSLFTLKFPELTGTRATKPDSCESFRRLSQDCGRTGGRERFGQYWWARLRVVWIAGGLWGFFCSVVTRKRKRYGSLFKRTIHTREITRLGRDGALK